MPDIPLIRMERDVLEVTGAESASYLQGQLSQDVLAVPVGATAWSWVLAPAGKVDALVRLFRRDDESWFVDTDAGWGEALMARLNRFKLRTKVEVVLTDHGVVGERGSGADPGEAGVRPLAVCEPWPGAPGRDLIVARADYDTVPAASHAYEVERVALGMPRMGAELNERTIPGETGLIDLTVSFTKGCYTGQELVARIDSRGGNVARRLARMVMDGPIEAGTDVYLDGQPAGVVTSSVEVDGGFIGLGYLKRGFEPPLTLSAGDGVEVRVEPSAG